MPFALAAAPQKRASCKRNTPRTIGLCIRIELLASADRTVHDRFVIPARYKAVDPDVEHLVCMHLHLVRALASRYLGRGESFDDLVQVASLALVGAARRFDPGRGVPFGAYAVPTIDGELRRHLRDRVGPLRVPRREQQSTARLRRASAEISHRLGREATVAEAAAATGMALGEAQRALALRRRSTPWSELELHASGTADEEIDACEVRALVQAGLQRLDSREREAVRLRFAVDLSQAEIGRRLHISQSQASRLLATALGKLRRELGPVVDRAA